MIKYTEVFPLSKELVPYIESFVIVKINTPEIDSKQFLSRPGANLLFSSVPIVVNNKVKDTSVVFGIGNRSTIIKWKDASGGDGLLVKFTPYGLSRFTAIAASQLTNTSLSASKLWGDFIRDLHRQIMATQVVSNKIELIEEFLIERLNEPDELDKYIFRLADSIRNDVGLNTCRHLVQKAPVSRRHVERRFKHLIGVNGQTLGRISHFDKAKSLIMKQQLASLTDIGYRSGYFDQAHFSKEFKRFTSCSPKVFFQTAPFYQVIADSKK
ncbi:helix-turn-helix domain-containing protein [Algoriphagus sp.]|uniref:helix-turn-helix domain-containing protein n=1 Tax=Algoriphagus sp. TaxID=1872435 RepID=UPI003F72C6F0